MEVRRLRADEWARWREHRLELLADSPDAFGSTYDETLARPPESFVEHVGRAATAPDTCIYVADDGERWLASAGAFTEDDAPHSVCLFTVWTRPEARGQGVQTRVIETVLDWARERGRTSATLWVADANVPALACYTKLGFRPTGRTQLMRETIPESELARPL